jgi:hypothetical protein
MKDEKLQTELLKSVKDFYAAIQKDDKDKLNQIVDGHLLLEYNMSICGLPKSKKSIPKDELLNLEQNLPSSVRETKPFVFVRRNEAEIVFEKFSHCHLPISKFDHIFLRQVYIFEKRNKNWKLKLIKDELSRFSRYNLKWSLWNSANYFVCFISKSFYKSNER